MNPAQNTAQSDDNQKTAVTPPSVASSAGKEQEKLTITPGETVSAVGAEVELPKEVEKAGVTIVRETIEIPPDIKKLGVTPAGASTPVVTTATPAPVALPISDKEIITGLNEQILSSLRWLAVWCVRKLKKAHIALKNIHGKIIRVET